MQNLWHLIQSCLFKILLQRFWACVRFEKVTSHAFEGIIVVVFVGDVDLAVVIDAADVVDDHLVVAAAVLVVVHAADGIDKVDVVVPIVIDNTVHVVVGDVVVDAVADVVDAAADVDDNLVVTAAVLVVLVVDLDDGIDKVVVVVTVVIDNGIHVVVADVVDAADVIDADDVADAVDVDPSCCYC